MRALIVVSVAALLATGLAALFVALPMGLQVGFRDAARGFFRIAKVISSGMRDELQASLTTRETFVSAWFVAFVVMLFVSGYTAHKWWP